MYKIISNNLIKSLSKTATASFSAQSMFGHVPMPAPDMIFGMNQRFKNDTAPDKMSLVIGAYRDDDGKPYVFPVIKKVERKMLEENLNKEYLNMEGDPDFIQGARKLLFGRDTPKDSNMFSIQSLSGTGSLRIAATFLNQFYNPNLPIYISNPTWPNHFRVFTDSGLTNQVLYPYYDSANNTLNYTGMMDSLRAAPQGSVILMHSCAHNPTGVDPTPDQWKEILKVVKSNNLLPFFDSAYQGFATGDLDNDAYSVRLFAQEKDLTFLVAQSFAKNAGVYGERVGALHMVCPDEGIKDKLYKQIQLVVRGSYSNPPVHGARLLSRVLNNPDNYLEWKNQLKDVADRIKAMRQALFDELVAIKTPGNWEHIVRQIGMFSYSGLTTPQCDILIEKHHVYLLRSGRMSMSGINTKNVKKLAAGIKDAVTTAPPAPGL